jgi:hypothetical protein
VLFYLDHSGDAGEIEAAGLEACGDILHALESVMDVSITHPSGVANHAAAATTDGAAASQRDREKRRTYGQLEPNGDPFIPFLVQTYSQMGKPAISLARRRRRQGARLAGPALWRLPSGSLAWGCTGVTITCIGHRWACRGVRTWVP